MLKKLILSALAASVCVPILFYIFCVSVIESKTPEAISPAYSQFLSTDGERLAYSEIDNGAPVTVIFVGGLSAWAGTWERSVRMADTKTGHSYNFVALDLPPFGFSQPDPDRNYYRSTQAARIAEFINGKGFTRVILVGHSYGAGPLTEYALTNPDSVEKLILVAAVLNIDEIRPSAPSLAQIDWLRQFVIGQAIHIRPFGYSQLASFVSITENLDDELYDTYTQYFRLDGVSERLSDWFGDYLTDPLTYASTDSQQYREIAFPVRLIWGDRDTLTPLSGTEILLASVQDVSLQVLPGVGHIPMIEDYAQFDEALTRALYE